MKTKFICKDHSISGEYFELKYDSELDMLYTHPQPNEKEIEKYYESETYISHSDSNVSFTDKLYQMVKKIRLRRKIHLINSLICSEKNLLDVGCGTGDFLKRAEKNGWKITGIEPHKKARTLAQKKMTEKRKFYKSLDELLTKTEEKKEKKFDVISLWHVLEHLPNTEEYIGKLKSLLQPNGTLVIAVPNFKSYDAEYYGTYWAGYDVPRHLWHFSKKTLEKLFTKQQMHIEKILPMHFDAYYIALLSEKYKSGHQNFIKAFWVGFQSNWQARRTKNHSSLIYLIKRNKISL